MSGTDTTNVTSQDETPKDGNTPAAKQLDTSQARKVVRLR